MRWLFKFVNLFSLIVLVVGPIYYDDYDDYNAEEPPKPHMFISGGYRLRGDPFSKYLVSIRTASPTKYFGDNHFCAGTIIARAIVATAAHCVMDSRRIVTRSRRLRVVAGTPNRLRFTKNTVIFEVTTVVVHPDYVRNGPHDLAVLFLKDSIPMFNKYVKILPMVRRPVQKDTNCTSLGWGQIFHRGPYAVQAVYVDLTMLDDQDCAEIFGAAYDNAMMCADDKLNAESAACPGDSGGPLICGGKLAGIISWGSYCGNTFNPVLFTDIFEHRQWLREVNSANNLKNLNLFTLLLLLLINL